MGQVPGKWSIVLVCQPSGSDGWYYMGSTFEAEVTGMTDDPVSLDTKKEVSQRVEDTGASDGAGNGEPNRLVMKDDFGNKLGLYSEVNGVGSHTGVELRSGKGKSLRLIDSPGVDAIYLNTAGNDGGLCQIALGDDSPGDKQLGPDSITMRSTGSQNQVSFQGYMNMHVGRSGAEMSLTNHAQGTTTASGAAYGGRSDKFGDINLQSKHGDINLFTLGDLNPARIFIECLDPNGESQLIQIQARGDGTVRIKSGNKIEIDAGGDLDIKAGGNINMEGEAVNITAGGGGLKVRSGANIDAQASPFINLNPTSPVNPTPPVIGDTESKYGTVGIDTLD